MYEDDNMLVEVNGNFIYYYYKCQWITKEIAQNMLDTRLQLFQYNHVGILDLRNVHWVDLDAMRVFSTPDAYRQFTTTATILNNKVGTMLGNIYYKLVAAPYPTRLFNDINLAFDWLELTTEKKLPHFNIINQIDEEFTLNPN